jgi:hypothetical protein
MGDGELTYKYTITVEKDEPATAGYFAKCRVNDAEEAEHFAIGKTPSEALVHLAMYLYKFDREWRW